MNVNKTVIKKAILVLLAIFLTAGVSAGLFSRQNRAHADSTTQDVINFAIVVNLNDSPDISDSEMSFLNELYNEKEYCVKEYFKSVSRNALNLTTLILKDKSNAPYVTVEESEEYFRPKYEWNGSGYDLTKDTGGYDNRYYDASGNAVKPNSAGSKQHVDGYYREQKLIRRIVTGVQSIDSVYNPDSDGDGNVDSVSILINSGKLSNDDWGMILWPHMSGLCNNAESIKNAYYVPFGYDLSAVTESYPTILGKRVESYDVLSFDEIVNADGGKGNVGTLCHELTHTFGAIDYYSYLDQTYEYLGETDLMASTSAMPQYITTYVRQKMGWVGEKNIMKVTASGTYTLFPTTFEKDVVAMKIDLNDASGEYFLIEARTNKGKTFDSALADGGIMIYRINEEDGYLDATGEKGERYYGNMYCNYPKNGSANVYAFRLGGGGKITENVKTSLNPLEPRERVSLALLNTKKITDRSGFGKETIDKSTFGKENGSTGDVVSYSDGRNSGIVLIVTSENADGSFTFKIKIPGSSSGEYFKPNVSEPYVYTVKDGKLGVCFNAEDFGNKVELVVSATELTEEEFDLKTEKTVIDLTLPYKNYGATFSGLGKSGVRYVCYKTTYGGIYSSYGAIAVDMSTPVDDKTAFDFRKLDLLTKPTYKDGKITVDTDLTGYVVIAECSGNYATAEEVMANCTDYETFRTGLGEYSAPYDKKDVKAFVLTKDGVSGVYSFDGSSSGGIGGVIETVTKGCFGISCGGAIMLASVVAVCGYGIIKRKK